MFRMLRRRRAAPVVIVDEFVAVAAAAVGTELKLGLDWRPMRRLRPTVSSLSRVDLLLGRFYPLDEPRGSGRTESIRTADCTLRSGSVDSVRC